MDERRSRERVRTFLRGQIRFANRMASMDCLVRDLSSTGARLAVGQHGIVPERFELVIPQRETTFRCVMRWRRPDELGVVFETPAADGRRASTTDPMAVDLMLRVRQLELENEALRRQLAQVTASVPESA